MKQLSVLLLAVALYVAADRIKTAEEAREPQEYSDWPVDLKDNDVPQKQEEEMYERFKPKDEVDALNESLDIHSEKKNSF